MTQFIQVGELNFAYEAFGKPTHPALLLIMGLGAQMVIYHDKFCQALADQGFYVIRFDNRDIGLSSRIQIPKAPRVGFFLLLNFLGYTMSPPYTLSDMAEDVIGIMDALGLEKAHVVGTSMGGMVGQRLLINHPDRILSACLIMTSTLNPNLPRPRFKLIWQLIKPVRDAKNKKSVLAYMQHVYDCLAGSRYPIDAQGLETLRESVERSIDLTGHHRQAMAVAAGRETGLALKNVHQPVVVIHGDEDPLIPLAAGEDIAEHLPNATLEVINGMGHTLPAKQFSHFVKLITANAQKVC